MTTMPINNHPLTLRRLQFIGISVSKLTLKSINIIQPSNNYNIVSSFICWNQNIVHMKIQDTSFRMTKRRFRFRGQKIEKVSKVAKIRNRYNQVPHHSQNTFLPGLL